MMCHMGEKESWVNAAVLSGGSGTILCDTCEEYKLHGTGGPNCRTCPEAIRQFPGQPEEHYNWRECGCENCRELQRKYLRIK